MHKHLAVRGATTAGLAVAVIAAMTGFAPGSSAANHGAAATPRATLAKSAPGWLTHATRVGTTARTAQQTLQVYLAPNGGLANLQAAVTEVSTPGSSSYHHYLTPTQYYRAYAPSAGTVAAVTSWLRDAGLRVTSADPHARFLNVSGTAAAAEQAFGVTLARYTHDGQTVSAPAGAITLPGSVSSMVLGVDGLDTTVHQARVQTATGGPTADLTKAQQAAAASPSSAPPAAFVNAHPCSTYYGQIAAKYQADYKTPLPQFEGKTLPYAVCGYTGPQFRAAYEGGTALTGAGVSVGIIDAYAAPTIAKDANQYASGNGDGSYTSDQLTQTTDTPFTHQKLCGPSGWYGEETLDVEAVHAMAPDANIHYYGAKSCEDPDFLNTQREVVDDNAVTVVTNSYGEPDQDLNTDGIAAFEQVVMQGAMQGISFLFSSGDNGDELAATGIRQSDSSASDPYVTAVGGTSTAIGADARIAFQTGWGTDKYSLSSDGSSWTPKGFLYGAGGGYSTLFNRPTYQQRVVPSTAPAGRAVPDLAMDADPTTGMLVGETQTFPHGKVAYGQYRIGGTSLASPLAAGMVALAVQQADGGLGFLNPALYAPASSSSFSDIKGAPKNAGNVRVDYVNGVDPTGGLAYSVRTFDQDSSLKAVKGWDDVTGLGVPTPAFFAAIS